MTTDPRPADFGQTLRNLEFHNDHRLPAVLWLARERGWPVAELAGMLGLTPATVYRRVNFAALPGRMPHYLRQALKVTTLPPAVMAEVRDIEIPDPPANLVRPGDRPPKTEGSDAPRPKMPKPESAATPSPKTPQPARVTSRQVLRKIAMGLTQPERITYPPVRRGVHPGRVVQNQRVPDEFGETLRDMRARGDRALPAVLRVARKRGWTWAALSRALDGVDVYWLKQVSGRRSPPASHIDVPKPPQRVR